MLFVGNRIYLLNDENLIEGSKILFGEKWQENLMGKEQFRIQPQSLLRFRNPNYVHSIFEEILLGLIFLARIDGRLLENPDSIPTPPALIVNACVAISEILNLPLERFFSKIDASNDGETLDLEVNEKWTEFGDISLGNLAQAGLIVATQDNNPLIPEELQGTVDDCFLVPTAMFLAHIDEFEMVEF